MPSQREIYRTKYTHKVLVPKADSFFDLLMELKKNLVRKYGKGRKCLDIGCATGADLLSLLDDGYHVDGLDFCYEFLEKIQSQIVSSSQHKKRCRLIQGDAMALPFATDSYGCVFSLSTFYHIPDQFKSLQDIFRILKPGGHLVVDMGNSKSLNEIESKKIWTGAASYHFSVQKMLHMIRKAGFTVQEHRSFQLFPLYGGSDFLREYINPWLQDVLKQQKDGFFLDEWMASSPMVKRFSFRQLFVLRKPGNDSAEPLPPKTVPCPTEKDIAIWMHPERWDMREQALRHFKEGRIIEGRKIFEVLLKTSPADPFTALALAQLFDSKEYAEFAAKARLLLRRHVERMNYLPQTQKLYF